MKLFVENSASEVIKIGEDLEQTPEGYINKTNLIDVGLNYKDKILNQIQYNALRDWVLLLLLEKNQDLVTAFGLCNNEERKIICKFILMPYAVRLNYFTDSEDSENWQRLVIETEGSPLALLKGRSLIYQLLRLKVSDYVRREIWAPGDYYANLGKAQDFLRDVFFMKELFIASNDPEFKEFLNSNGRYTTGGFNSKNYWLQDLQNDLLTIYNSY